MTKKQKIIFGMRLLKSTLKLCRQPLIQPERWIRALVKIGFFVEIDQSGGGCSFLKLLLRFWMMSFVMAYGS